MIIIYRSSHYWHTHFELELHWNADFIDYSNQIEKLSHSTSKSLNRFLSNFDSIYRNKTKNFFNSSVKNEFEYYSKNRDKSQVFFFLNLNSNHSNYYLYNESTSLLIDFDKFSFVFN